MEFLKKLFGDGEALTFDQLVEKAKAANINAVDLSEGKYVSLEKYNDKTNALSGQVETLKGQLMQRDTDIADVQGKLAAAQGDATKLTEAQTQLTNLQNKYAADTQALEAKLTRQAYEFDIRERAGKLKFSSAAARKAFIAEAMGKEFKRDGETLLGYEDFVTKYKADDPGAFVPDEPPKPEPESKPVGTTTPPPQIVLPSGGKGPAGADNGFHFNFLGVRPHGDKQD